MPALAFLGALGIAVVPPPVVDAEIDHWLLEPETLRGRVSLWPGRTLAVEKIFEAKGSISADVPLEAQLQVSSAPPGIHVDPKLDLLSVEAGPEVGAAKIRARFVVWADSGATGGWLRFTLLVTRKKGLGDLVAKEPIELGIDRVELEPEPASLAPLFWGYRRAKASLVRSQNQLAAEGITASAEGRFSVVPERLWPLQLAYEQARRRMDAARRALEAASTLDTPEGKAALSWLPSLDRDEAMAQSAPSSAPTGELSVDRDDPFGGLRRSRPPIPIYRRALTLDDPELAYGGDIELTRARSRSRGRAATVYGLDYRAQAHVTAGLGIEVLIPTVLVELDLETIDSVYALGNPLVSAKYRYHLPALLGRRPVLTARGRWGIPVSGLHPVPRLPLLRAEDLGRAATIQQPWILAVEHTTLGLGANAAWQYEIVSVQLQLAADYFIPVVRGSATSRFFAITSGLSIGAQPFGDVVGFYAEGRLASLTAGPVRNELSIYAGARARWLDWLEPAVYVGYPFGSVERVSGLSIAFDLRIAYDVPETEEREARQSSDLLSSPRGDAP